MSLIDLVGKTPLTALSVLNSNPKVQVYAKLEGNNPAGSVKDRAAKKMIETAWASGRLKRGMKIVEPTSGNTGIALAMIAALHKIEIELVMPETATQERVSTMEAYGAKVILTPAELSMEGAIDEARRIVQQGGAIMLDQFSNFANPLAHYETTGPEIWKDTHGEITHFVSAMGTTGTIMGCSMYLKEKNPEIVVVGVQPTPGAEIPGIRRWPKEYLPKIYDASRVDQIRDVTREDADATTRRLACEGGLFCGVSAGGAVWAALEIANELESGVMVVVIPDRGDRYLSSSLFRK